MSMPSNLWARPDELLVDHLTEVGDQSESMASVFPDISKIAGQLHDLGKASNKWQQYLNEAKIPSQTGKRRKTIPHAIHGAIAAIDEMKFSVESFMIACLIKSHHNKLKFVHDQDRTLADDTLSECKQNVETFFGGNLINCQINKIKKKKDTYIDQWFLLKYLFSVLVDADRLDASGEKLNGKAGQTNVGLINTDLISYNQPRFDLFQETLITFTYNFKFVFPAIDHEPLKDDFMSEILNANYTNLNTITAPCGLGKTIASLAKACQIANKEGKDRIIYVGPLKSIIEQTADVYRQCLPELNHDDDNNILEHHSDVEFDEDDDDETVKNYEKNCARWDSKVIVTTMVQFVDSLTSSHATKNRKLHHLENSVIIIDESQTLPENTLIYDLLFFDYLAREHKVTFILMSATQPHFKNLNAFNINKLPFNELLSDDKINEYFSQRRLCTVTNLTKEIKTNEQLTALLDKYPQPKLVVMNTTQSAFEFFQEMNRKQPGQWLHLSSRMCVDHRRKVIAEIKKNNDINVVSTQVVEAGVDISRFVVVSQLAPADSLIQRMGRCNRFGNGPDGIFLIVGTEQTRPYTQFRIDQTTLLLNDYDIASEQCELISEYFGSIYTLANGNSTLKIGKNLVENIRNNLEACLKDSIRDNVLPQKSEKKWDFSFCCEGQYKAIPPDDYYISVLCLNYQGFPYSLEELQTLRMNKRLWRKLSKFYATIPSKQFDINGEIFANGLAVWLGEYDVTCGVLF